MQIKYIDDDKNKGILYNYKKLNKEFKALNVPRETFNTAKLPFNYAKYFTLLSERATGKTTNLLLYGMLMNRDYGTILHYIRQRDSMIMNKTIKDLFKTIIEFNYIEKITDGKYNNVVYNARRWYYAKINENGEVEDIAPEHFMFCCSIEKSKDLKSGYNSPKGDFIILDEFISNFYYPNEFVELEDLISTIIRKRESPIIFLLANTIDINSIYFSELCIDEIVSIMNIGDSDIIETPMGTRVYVEFIEPQLDEEKKKAKSKHNQLFFGFPNKKLNAIKGGEWATASYQHIPTNKSKLLSPIAHLYFNKKLLQIEIHQNENIGICAYIHPSSTLYNDSRIYTATDIIDKRYIYKFGYSKFDKFIWDLYKKNLFFYSNNSVGALVSAFVNYCKKL